MTIDIDKVARGACFIGIAIAMMVANFDAAIFFVLCHRWYFRGK